MFEILQPLWQQSTTVQFFEGELPQPLLEHIKRMSFGENLTLITNVLTCRFGDNLAEHCQITGRNYSLCYFPDKFEPFIDLSVLCWPNLEEVHINPLVKGRQHVILSSDPFEAPSLKRLSLCNLMIDIKTLVFLSTAMREGKLPKLTDLSLAGSDFRTGSKLLFHCTWPSLTHLDLNECSMSEKFATSLQDAFWNNLFPELMSLNILIDPKQLFPELPSRLTELSLHFVADSSGISGKLHDLFKCNSFPLLQTLVLRKCGLTSQDLISLAEAKVDAKLPELKHLDISQNDECLDALHSLCQFKCRWESLLSLNIVSLGHNLLNQLSILVKEGCFGSLEELHTSVGDNSEIGDIIHIKFPFLRNLNINVRHTHKNFADIFVERVLKIRKGIFPSLKTCILCSGKVGCNQGTSRQRIQRIKMVIE